MAISGLPDKEGKIRFSEKALRKLAGGTICTDHDVRDVLSGMVEESSQKAAAAQIGISTSYMGDLLHGNSPISERVAEQLGMVRLTVFVRFDRKRGRSERGLE